MPGSFFRHDISFSRISCRTSSMILVPFPGEELIVSSPPTARALSSILNRPTPWDQFLFQILSPYLQSSL